MTDEPKVNESGEGEGQSGAEGSKEEPKLFTQEELNRIVAREKAQVKAAYDKQEAEKRKQAEIEKLDGEERIKAQYQADLDKERNARAEAEKNLRIARAGTSLSKLGYDPEFAPMMAGATDEETEANITRLDQMIKGQVTKIVQASNKRGAPPVPEGGPKGSSLRDEIFKAAGLNKK